MKKKLVALLMAVAMVASVTACGAKEEAPVEAPAEEEAEAPAEENVVIKVGVAAQLTGADPLEGEHMKAAIDMAVEELEAAGGIEGVTIEVQYEDQQGTPEGALNAAQKLIADDCICIIGPQKSTQVLAMAETVDAAGIPNLYGGTSPKLVGISDYMFGCRTNDTYAAKIGAVACADTLGAKSVGIFHAADDYGSGGMEVAAAYFDEVGVEYVTEAYNTGDTDVSGQVLKLMNANADAILFWGHGVDLAVVTRTFAQLGCEIPTVSASGIAIQQYIDLCDVDAIDGWYGVGEYVATNDAEISVEFGKRFEEYSGDSADMYAATYYGAFQAVLEAVRMGARDRESLKDCLQQIEGLEAPLATMTCKDNMFINEMVMIQMDENVPVVLEVVKAE